MKSAALNAADNEIFLTIRFRKDNFIQIFHSKPELI